MSQVEDNSEGAYQITLDGHGAYSAPYLDRDEATERADHLQDVHDIGEFYVEPTTSGSPNDSIEE